MTRRERWCTGNGERPCPCAYHQREREHQRRARTGRCEGNGERPCPCPHHRRRAAWSAARRERHPEDREASAAWHRVPENRGRKLANKAVWYRENRDKELARYAVYARKNRAVMAAKNSRRRARLRNAAVNDLTAAQWKEIKRAHGNRCYFCGRGGKMTQEHLVPLSRGGSNTKSNVAPACGSCNSSKCDKTAAEYRAWLAKREEAA